MKTPLEARTPLVVVATLASLLSIALAQAPRPAGMFELYANNRAAGTPNYITGDFLLLAYSLTLDQAVADAEQRDWYPALRSTAAALTKRAQSAGDGETELANRRYLTVFSALLEGHESDPDAAVAAELKLIREAKIGRSGLLAQTIDFSQFRPRGHYTRTPELTRYFLAVQYAASALFPVQPSEATGIDAATADKLTRQAVQVCSWIQESSSDREAFSRFDTQRQWLFGPAEDLGCRDLLQISGAAPEAKPAQWRAQLLEHARKNGRQPAIWNAVFDPVKLEKGLEVQDVLTGWRLIPGSFTPDSAAAQQLVYGRVGKYLGEGKPLSLTSVNGEPVKGFPLAAEMLGLLGSREALRRLAAGDETNYKGYDAARKEAQRLILRPAGLPGLQIRMLETWLKVPDPSGAARYQTAAGFWTLYRHGNVLYAKQSYTGTGKGMEKPDERSAAWIEPSIELYMELRRISAQIEGHITAPKFAAFSQLLDQAIDISQDERAGRKPSPEQVAFLNSLDKSLLRLAGAPDQPIAVDIHTDVNSGQTMVEALAVPAEDFHVAGTAKMRGARFRHREFKHPMDPRITDETWREMLAREGAAKK